VEVYRHARLEARNNWPSALCDSGVWIERGQPFRELGGASVNASPDLRPLWIYVPSHTRNGRWNEPSLRSGVSAERRWLLFPRIAALCRDAATPEFVDPRRGCEPVETSQKLRATLQAGFPRSAGPGRVWCNKAA